MLAHKAQIKIYFVSGAPSHEIKDEPRKRRRMRSSRFYECEGRAELSYVTRKTEDRYMGRALRTDMYEDRYVRKRAAGEYREPLYDRRIQAGRSGEAENGRVVWKEPMYVSSANGKKRTDAYRETRRESGYGKKSVHRRKRRKVQYKILRGILIYFIMAGIAVTCFMIFSLLVGGKEKVHAEEAAKGGRAVVENTLRGLFSKDDAQEDGDVSVSGEQDIALYEDGQAETMPEITPQIRQECQNLYAAHTPLLVLVNKEYELPASYEAGLRNICEGRLQAADILYEDLCAMLRDGGQAGFQYWIASAHRDRAYQQGLVDEDVEKYMSKGYSYEAALERTYEYTMPAGKSEHETGLALDILCSTNTIMDESQKYEPGNQWLVEHCHEYGFILRYPEDKESVTGIKYEPWHFRYVGREAAAYLKENGWTLEEFYEAVNGPA